MDNANTKEYLDKIRAQVVENLKRTAFAPSVQMTDVPRDPLVEGMDDEADAIMDDLDEDENKDKRYTQRRFDQYVEKPGELSDSEDEDENTANGVRRQPNALKRRNQVNYRNLDAGDSGLDSGMATPQDASSIPDDDMDTTVDAKATEAALEPETEAAATPSAAEPPSRAEEASNAEQNEMAIDGPEQTAPSAPVSRPESPKAQDEDTTMEDVGEPEAPPEPEQTEQPAESAPAASEAPEGEEKKPAEATPAPEQPAPEEKSPAKEQAPPKEAPEQPAQDPTEAEKLDELPEPTAETKEKTPEAPKDEPAPEKTEPEAPAEKEPTPEKKSEEPAKSEE